jgi:hypothetical protein
MTTVIFHFPAFPLQCFLFLLLYSPFLQSPLYTGGHISPDSHDLLLSSSPDHNYQGDGTGWLSFTGEINVDSEVTIGGFRAAGLWVKVRLQILSFLREKLNVDIRHRTVSFSRLRPLTRTKVQLVICAVLFLFGW